MVSKLTPKKLTKRVYKKVWRPIADRSLINVVYVDPWALKVSVLLVRGYFSHTILTLQFLLVSTTARTR